MLLKSIIQFCILFFKLLTRSQDLIAGWLTISQLEKEDDVSNLLSLFSSRNQQRLVLICKIVYLSIHLYHGQDVTKGKFLSRFQMVSIWSFLSPRLIALPRLEKPVYPVIYQ